MAPALHLRGEQTCDKRLADAALAGYNGIDLLRWHPDEVWQKNPHARVQNSFRRSLNSHGCILHSYDNPLSVLIDTVSFADICQNYTAIDNFCNPVRFENVSRRNLFSHLVFYDMLAPRQQATSIPHGAALGQAFLPVAESCVV